MNDKTRYSWQVNYQCSCIKVRLIKNYLPKIESEYISFAAFRNSDASAATVEAPVVSN